MFMSSEYKPYLNNKIFKIKKTQHFFIEDIWKNPNQSVNLIAGSKQKKQLQKKNVENIRSSKIKYRKNL